MKICFLINNRNKAQHVYKAVQGALAQTYPCEILISDQGSTDNSLEVIGKAILECPRGAEHEIRVVSCPIDGPYCMATGNLHMDWCVKQTDADFILQCSADDYSLENRVKVCMEAIEKNPCSAIATTMFFTEPDVDITVGAHSVSGFPTETGYVPAGEGIARLAYGSVIAGYSREFLEKMPHAGPNTIDVLWGYLAALDKGFYVIAEPHHVHVKHASAENMGFGGKMLAAENDPVESMRVAELNHAQLYRLYHTCALQAVHLHPEGVRMDAWDPLVNMIFGQAQAWLGAREVLSANGITPGTL